jgi:hypothetical protein
MQPFMNKFIVLLIIYFAVNGCKTDCEEVTLSQYSYGKHLIFEDQFCLSIERTNDYTKYILNNDSSGLYLAPSFMVPSSTDSVIYSEDVVFKLIDKKQFRTPDSNFEILKYQDIDGYMTLFFNRYYGPIILRGNDYKGHETWDRPSKKERQLIDIIRNDSVDFGGI